MSQNFNSSALAFITPIKIKDYASSDSDSDINIPALKSRVSSPSTIDSPLMSPRKSL